MMDRKIILDKWEAWEKLAEKDKVILDFKKDQN